MVDDQTHENPPQQFDTTCSCGARLLYSKDAVGNLRLVHGEPYCDAYLKDRPVAEYFAEIVDFHWHTNQRQGLCIRTFVDRYGMMKSLDMGKLRRVK